MPIQDGGSSPRMRGAPRVNGNLAFKWGIIPAYAGSTPSERMSTPNSWDHPHVCGEHRSTDTDASSKPGSSPRMRGALSD